MCVWRLQASAPSKVNETTLINSGAHGSKLYIYIYIHLRGGNVS